MTDPLIATLRAGVDQVEGTLGLAVSGGGDSVAMLCLAVAAGLPVAAVTVDHGLRPEAAAEAAWVADLCAGLGVPHQTLRWTGWNRAGNLQDQARRARLRLVADWALGRGIGAVALGHTQDDQAETVLMRLARRAGVDGLSAMRARRRYLGVVWLRPLLGVGRADLRAFLRGRGQGWIDDPSNDALRFDRVKARAALALLEPLGIDTASLAAVAQNLGRARDALNAQTHAAAQVLVTIEAGDVVIDAAGFSDLPVEVRRRLIVAALMWVGSAEYSPRAVPVQGLLTAIGAGRGGTLAGCRVLTGGGRFRVLREARAVAGAVGGQVWDQRWQLSGPDFSGLEVRALGAEGLAQVPDWRLSGLPRASLIASPAIWRGGVLIAAPLARPDPSWQARIDGGEAGFFHSILSH